MLHTIFNKHNTSSSIACDTATWMMLVQRHTLEGLPSPETPSIVNMRDDTLHSNSERDRSGISDEFYTKTMSTKSRQQFRECKRAAAEVLLDAYTPTQKRQGRGQAPSIHRHWWCWKRRAELMTKDMNCPSVMSTVFTLTSPARFSAGSQQGHTRFIAHTVLAEPWRRRSFRERFVHIAAEVERANSQQALFVYWSPTMTICARSHVHFTRTC